MLKFQKFDPRSGETVDLKPCLCNFGLSAIAATLISSLAVDAGVGAATAGTIGSIAGPALVGAGLGAAGSAITGGNPGQGALFGGLGGAFMPALGALGVGSGSGSGGGGLLGNIFGGGSGNPTLTGQAAQNMESGNTGATALDAEGNPINSYATGAAGMDPAAKTAAATAGGIKTPSGTGGSIPGLGLGATLGVLGALMQSANRPATTQAPTPAGFSQPWNPAPTGTLARRATPFTPTTGSYYTYGQQAEPQFFSGNALNFNVPGTAPGMAKGGALRHAIRSGHYGGHFSTGGGDHYVEGEGGGQDDNIDARLSPGEYVMDASTVSRLGDGNNEEGARRLDEMRHSIANDAGTNRVVQKKTRAPLEYLRRAA